MHHVKKHIISQIAYLQSWWQITATVLKKCELKFVILDILWSSLQKTKIFHQIFFDVIFSFSAAVHE